MTLFYGSQKTIGVACQEIADAGGASADTQMLDRALRSLNAAIQYFDGKAYWDWLLVEGPTLDLVAPFTWWVTAASGQASCTASAGTHGVQIGDLVIGDIFALGTRVSATAVSSMYFNRALSSGFTAVAGTSLSATFFRDTYPCPSDFRAQYSARLLSSQRTLRMLRRRLYDRSVVDELSTTNTPQYYDVFFVGSSGKLRFLPGPSVEDVFQWRYYRHMATASATGAAASCDIPSQYESYLIAQAKWHFLTDKGEGRSQQAQTWLAFAQEGLKVMLRDNSQLPDEDSCMLPGHYWYDIAHGPNSVHLDEW